MVETVKARSAPFFEPWVGHKYDATGERLLVLGESHYGSPCTPGNTTIELTKKYAEGLWTHRFWTNVMQVVLGRSHREIDRMEFWGSVAFYNYVQQVVVDNHGVAPTSEMFASSKEAFFAVLDCLAPKSILVLSARLWDNLPSEGRPGPDIFVGETGRETWIYPYRGGEARASWIPHPSWGFSWRQWHPWVNALLVRREGPDEY